MFVRLRLILQQSLVSFAGCKRARAAEEESIESSSPVSRVEEAQQPTDIAPPPLPQAGTSHSSSSGSSNSGQIHPEETSKTPPLDLTSSEASLSHSSDHSALETLVRLFPGRKTDLLESVLTQCKGDALKAIQMLLYISPSSPQSPAPPSANVESSSIKPPAAFQSIEDQLPPPCHTPEHPVASLPFPNPALSRFTYQAPHPFMYPPFLPTRPEYYPHLNLSASGVSMLPPRDESPSPPMPDKE